MANVVVLGGGISGLSCAYYLSTLGKNFINKVTLIEKKPSLGGWIQTTRFPDGTIYEHGPRSLRPSGVSGLNTLKLVEELGISDKVLPLSVLHPAAQKRLVLVNDQLHTLPNSIRYLFRKNPPFSKPLISSVIKDLVTRKKVTDDESLHSFACRRFGQEVADYFMDPLCRGIVAGDSKEISMRSLMTNIFNAEQEYGSVIWGMRKQMQESRKKDPLPECDLEVRCKKEHWAMWTFQNGFQCLPETLCDFLEKDQSIYIYTNSPCAKLKFENGKAMVITENTRIEADHVFACIPAKHLSRLVSVQHPSLANLLSSIPAVHVALVNLEFHGRVLEHEGFGFLVPSNQNSKLLGVIFDSCCFPAHDGKYEDKTRITCMMGGRWFKEFFGDVDTITPDQILEIAIQEIHQHLGIKEPVTRHHVSILRNCIPQYQVGHYSIVNQLNEQIMANQLNLSLLGASYDGVGVNDCIYNARKCIEKYVEDLNR